MVWMSAKNDVNIIWVESPVWSVDDACVSVVLGYVAEWFWTNLYIIFSMLNTARNGHHDDERQSGDELYRKHISTRIQLDYWKKLHQEQDFERNERTTSIFGEYLILAAGEKPAKQNNALGCRIYQYTFSFV